MDDPTKGVANRTFLQLGGFMVLVALGVIGAAKYNIGFSRFFAAEPCVPFPSQCVGPGHLKNPDCTLVAPVGGWCVSPSPTPTITPTPTSFGTITVVTPNGGEVFHVNDTMTIRFTASGYQVGTQARVFITYLMSDSTRAQDEIARFSLAGTTNTTVFPFVIPAKYGNVFDQSQFRIRLAFADGSQFGVDGDYSDANFTIVSSQTPTPTPTPTTSFFPTPNPTPTPTPTTLTENATLQVQTSGTLRQGGMVAVSYAYKNASPSDWIAVIPSGDAKWIGYTPNDWKYINDTHTTGTSSGITGTVNLQIPTIPAGHVGPNAVDIVYYEKNSYIEKGRLPGLSVQ